MNITRVLVPAALSALFALTSTSFARNQSEESREKPIRLSEVPQAARDAAQKALGTAPTEAKIVNGTSAQEYELEAKDKSGKEHNVHVRADGKVVKHENEEDEANERDEH
jgi:hypothetical protein